MLWEVDITPLPGHPDADGQRVSGEAKDMGIANDLVFDRREDTSYKVTSIIRTLVYWCEHSWQTMWWRMFISRRLAMSRFQSSPTGVKQYCTSFGNQE